MWLNGTASERIGLLAGKGDLPVLFAQAAASLKKKLVVIGVEGLTDRRMDSLAEKVHYVRLGDVESVPRLLKESRVSRIAMAGGIPKRELYNADLQMDSSARAFIGGTANKGDDHLLRAFQFFLKTRGVTVLDSRKFLKDLLAPKGVLSGRRPTDPESKDLRFGFDVAKGIGKMDIGQTVVVKQGVVLAVEAIEGTDQAIRRGGELGGPGAAAVKVAKPNQNLRFDLPCVGLETLEALKTAGITALGVEAGKTIMIGKERLLEEADRFGLSVVGL